MHGTQEAPTYFLSRPRSDEQAYARSDIGWMCASERRAPALESGLSRAGGEPASTPLVRCHARMCGVLTSGDGAASVRGVLTAGGVMGAGAALRGASAGGGVRVVLRAAASASSDQALIPSTRGVMSEPRVRRTAGVLYRGGRGGERVTGATGRASGASGSRKASRGGVIGTATLLITGVSHRDAVLH